MLKVENVTKIYKKNSSLFQKEEDFVALNNISFELEKDKVLSVQAF